MFSGDWFPSLSMVSSQMVRVTQAGPVPFIPRLADSHDACMCVEHVLLFPSSTDGPLSCFYLFVVNSAAVHAGDVSAPAPALRTKPQSGDARAGGNSVFSPFGELPCCFPQQHNLLPSHPQCTRAPSLATILSGCEPEGIALFLKTDLMKRV